MARQFHTIQEVMDFELDQSEGGGLGLIITVLMLRKIGIDESSLKLTSTAQGTEARLIVPPLAEQGQEILASAVVEAINQIPQFPDHVLRILRILEDPTKSFVHIGPIIRQDSSLIASLLKAANSPLYSLHRAVESIDDAVAILGLPAIQEMLIAVTAEKLLVSTYHRAAVQRIMDHSLEVAWYCRELTKAAKIVDNAANVYVCAMLHDFGEIIVNALVPGLTDRIAELCRAKGWNSFQAETLTNGFNHSLVGAALAEKWQFPEKIVEVIRYHHLPQEASRKAAPIVGIVYLGDFLWQKARDLVGWEDLVPSVLETFSHKTKDEWLETFRAVLDKRKSL
jgi:putative nucleotidyltransferase with HDIG domain